MQRRAWCFALSMAILVGSLCAAALAEETIPAIPGVATYSVADAVREVKRTKRPVFAVSYSDTCPVCQRLLKTLASEESLRPVTAQFVNVRINVESPEFRPWERSYPRPSTSIPGVYVVDSSGKAIDLRAGGQSVEELRTMLSDGLQEAGRLPKAEQLAALRKAAEAARPLVASGDFSGALLALKAVQGELAQFYDGLLLSDEGRAIRQIIDPIVTDGQRRLNEALASKSDAWATAWTIACLKAEFGSFAAFAEQIDVAEEEFSKDAAQKVLLRQAGELYRAEQLYGADRSERGRKALERIVAKYKGKPVARMAANVLIGREIEAASGAARDYRTWSDRTGKFSIKATFRSAVGGRVSLLRPDGKVIEVPLEKLSEADQQFVARQAQTF